MNIINIEHISKRFGDKFLFEDASFGVQEGDKIGDCRNQWNRKVDASSDDCRGG